MTPARMRRRPPTDAGTATANGDWLSLHEAAALLGVHPGTVRGWSDKGLLPVYRTRGGHRRFKRGELELWASTSRGGDVIDPPGVMQAALGRIRLKISEGQLEGQSWYTRLDDQARAGYRESAQALFQGLMRYVAGSGDDGQADARALGYEYARRAQQAGLQAADAARAFLFFREALLHAVIEVYQVANVPSGRAWGEVLRGVNGYTDLILIHLLETFRDRERRTVDAG